MSKFSVAGVSTQHGVTKVRFANDLVSRTKLLAKGGHSPLELVELPRAMTKAEACQHLLSLGGVFKQWETLITETMDKKSGVPAAQKAAVKAPSKKAVVHAQAAVSKAQKVKATAKTEVAKKVAKPKVEEDFEINELKDIADAPI